MSDKYTDLLDDADRIAVVDLYPARLRTVISDLSAALRETSALLTESRDYGSALVEELRARTEKLDQLLLLANSMDADFESYTKVHPAVQPKVKPLVWHEGDEPDEWKSGPYDVWREFGRYQLYHWSVVVGEPHKTASAAKAAAQADHEARILPALEPAVQPDLEHVAFSMWKAEADQAAPNVGKHRTPQGFAEASNQDRTRWLTLADAAIAALKGESK